MRPEASSGTAGPAPPDSSQDNGCNTALAWRTICGVVAAPPSGRDQGGGPQPAQVGQHGPWFGPKHGSGPQGQTSQPTTHHVVQLVTDDRLARSIEQQPRDSVRSVHRQRNGFQKPPPADRRTRPVHAKPPQAGWPPAPAPGWVWKVKIKSWPTTGGRQVSAQEVIADGARGWLQGGYHLAGGLVAHYRALAHQRGLPQMHEGTHRT